MLIDGVVKLPPVPNKLPPVAALYQFKFPKLDVALNTKLPTSHLAAGVVVKTTGVKFTVAKIAVLDD